MPPATNVLLDRNQVIMTTGVRLEVTFNVSSQGGTKPGHLTQVIDLAKKAQTVDHVYCIVRIATTVEDQLCVTAYTMTSTEAVFKKAFRQRPAVVECTTISAFFGLPSLVQADLDMVVDFAKNLFGGIHIEHNCTTGENSIVVCM